MTRKQATLLAKKLFGDRGGAWNLGRKTGHSDDPWPFLQVGEIMPPEKDYTKDWKRGTAPHRATRGHSNVSYLEAFRDGARAFTNRQRQKDYLKRLNKAIKELDI